MRDQNLTGTKKYIAELTIEKEPLLFNALYMKDQTTCIMDEVRERFPDYRLYSRFVLSVISVVYKLYTQGKIQFHFDKTLNI